MKSNMMLFVIAALFSAVTVKAQQNTTKRAIQELVNTVSQEGSIPLTHEQKTVMAGWLQVNGESITNVHPSRLKAEGPSSADPSAGYTSGDFKFAESTDALYVFAMDVPQADMKIKALRTTIGGRIIGTVKLLGSDERMSWEQEERELNLEKPHVLPGDGVTVFKITWTEYYKEKPVDETIKILEP